MKKYMYQGTWTQELEDAVENSVSKPLVEEMFCKYGLTVYARSNTTRNSFLMTMDGLPYCEVYIGSEVNAITKNTEKVYYYFSHFYTKDRGGDLQNKRTLRSNKMAKLISTINKKQALMPSHAFILTPSLLKIVSDTIRAKITKPNSRKSLHDVEVPMVEKLLNHALNKTLLSGRIQYSIKYYLTNGTQQTIMRDVLQK